MFVKYEFSTESVNEILPKKATIIALWMRAWYMPTTLNFFSGINMILEQQAGGKRRMSSLQANNNALGKGERERARLSDGKIARPEFVRKATEWAGEKSLSHIFCDFFF